jgi:Rad3-related DNA helicase
METEFKFDEYFPFEKYREYQKEVIDKTIGVFESGKKFVILEAPTGIGKSAIAYTVGEYYLNTLDRSSLDIYKRFHGPPVIVCTKTRQLQNQYVESFGIGRLWSSRHYFCSLDPTHKEFYYGSPLCIDNNCPELSSCAFLSAKQKFMNSDIGVLNYHYYIYSLFNDKFRPKFLVLDEAHNIENILCDIFTLNINKKRIVGIFEKALEMNVVYSSDVEEVTKLLEYIISSETIDDDLISKFRDLSNFISMLCSKGGDIIKEIKELFEGKISDIRLKERAVDISKLILYFENIQDKLSLFVNGSIGWIISEKKIDSIKFKPLEIGYLSDKLFNSSNRILFMSATICGAHQFCKDINIDFNECEFIGTPSIIPPKNRKVFTINGGTINYKNKKEIFPKIISIMDDMIDKIEEDKGSVRGIIHSVSYTNAKTIKDLSKHSNRMIIPIGSEILDIGKILRMYDNTIVVSPSIMEGVDLKDDLSRFQIFPKVPFLSLEDKWISRKMKRDNTWYIRKAIMNIIQGSGRSIRTESDWSVTVIFDSSFRRLLKKYRGLFSRWYIDAISIINID